MCSGKSSVVWRVCGRDRESATQLILGGDGETTGHSAAQSFMITSARTLSFVMWSLPSELGTPISTIFQHLKTQVFLDHEPSSHLPPKPDRKLLQPQAVTTPHLSQESSARGR